MEVRPAAIRALGHHQRPSPAVRVPVSTRASVWAKNPGWVPEQQTSVEGESCGGTLSGSRESFQGLSGLWGFWKQVRMRWLRRDHRSHLQESAQSTERQLSDGLGTGHSSPKPHDTCLRQTL